MEDRVGLLVDASLTGADGRAERVAALHMIEPDADQPNAITVGGDRHVPALERDFRLDFRQPVDQVLDVRHMPQPAPGSPNAAIVQRRGKPEADLGRLKPGVTR